MPEPEWIAIQKDLAALTARVAAFEKAQKLAEGPPALDDDEYVYLVPTKYKDYEMPPNGATRRKAAARLRWCEAELARLREGLKVQTGDVTDTHVLDALGFYEESTTQWRMAREIQRYRKMVAK